MTTNDDPYRIENGEGYCILALKPELSNVQWAEIERVGDAVLEKIREQRSPSFMVDLSSLSYMGSSMVALIVRLWKMIKEREGRMVVVNKDPLVYEVLKLAGLDQVWSIVESREEGAAALGKRRRAGSGPLAAAVTLLQILALVAGAAGLYLLMNRPVGWDTRVALGIMLVAALVGLVCGAVGSVTQAGVRRLFGMAVLAVSLGMLVAGVMELSAIAGEGSAVDGEKPPLPRMTE